MDQKERKPRIAETTFRVRFAETDQMGVVHHAAYVVYLEEGRSELSRQFGASYAEFEKTGYALAVTELSLRYIAAARYDNRITVRTWIEQIQSRSMTYNYEVVNEDNRLLLVTGMSRHICLDESGQVRRIPQGWLEGIKAKMYLD